MVLVGLLEVPRGDVEVQGKPGVEFNFLRLDEVFEPVVPQGLLTAHPLGRVHLQALLYEVTHFLLIFSQISIEFTAPDVLIKLLLLEDDLVEID